MTTQEGMGPEALELFGAIVSANVAQQAHTTDWLLKVKDDQIRDLRQTLVRLGAVLNAATVMDRKTEARLTEFWWQFEDVADALAQEKSSQ